MHHDGPERTRGRGQGQEIRPEEETRDPSLRMHPLRALRGVLPDGPESDLPHEGVRGRGDRQEHYRVMTVRPAPMIEEELAERLKGARRLAVVGIGDELHRADRYGDRKSTRLNSSHQIIS